MKHFFFLDKTIFYTLVCHTPLPIHFIRGNNDTHERFLKKNLQLPPQNVALLFDVLGNVVFYPHTETGIKVENGTTRRIHYSHGLREEYKVLQHVPITQAEAPDITLEELCKKIKQENHAIDFLLTWQDLDCLLINNQFCSGIQYIMFLQGEHNEIVAIRFCANDEGGLPFMKISNPNEKLFSVLPNDFGINTVFNLTRGAHFLFFKK